MEKLIDVEGLSTHYSTFSGAVKATDNVSLKIHKGESVALVGESGSGKSTIAFSLMQLISNPGKIISGEVIFNGRDIMKLNKSEITKIRGGQMGMIFQEPMTFLNPLIRVGEQIAEAIRIQQDANHAEAKEKAVEALRLVQLPNPETIANYYPHQLSGGMRQRVLIAIAISCRPHLLIADEPTTALDVTIQAQIMQLLHKLCKELDTALLLITHDLGLVAEYCDRVYVMYAGQIVEEADIFKLFKSPKHPYTQALLAEVPRVDSRRRRFKPVQGEIPSPLDPPTGCHFHPRCPHAIETCAREQPELREIVGGRLVACHLAESISAD